MNSSDPLTELHQLCDRLLDGTFTPEDRARLEALVLGNPSLRQHYVELMHEHAALRQIASQFGESSPGDMLRDLPAPMPGPRRRGLARWVGLAAGILVGIGGVGWLITLRSDRPVATLLETNGALWENSEQPTAPGTSLRRGRMRLEAGLARLVFRSGAEVRLEGPVDFELRGPNASFLHAGVLTAHVPERARGFVVETSSAKLIDHGTDFGISATSGGRAQVQVLQGEVELKHTQSGESRRLLSRESAAITPQSLISPQTSESEFDLFPSERNGDRSARLIVNSAMGDGDAAYVVSPNSRHHVSDTLLLLKNHTGNTHLRKAVVRFDLSAAGSRLIQEARLVLNFETTGFGYLSMTGDCVYAVYGVTDDSQDQWSAGTLRWDTLPAFSPDAGAVDQERATKLGTFVIPGGIGNGTFGITGEALVRFLNADKNRHATIVIVRETVANAESAVHGFAGNRHPSLAPPTLTLSLTPSR